MNPHWLTHLEQQGAQFADGRVAHYGDPVGERDALHRGPVLCDLSHDGLILVSGEDAAAFLHNQLSNDVLALREGDAQHTSWCSPKGRMLVSPLLWRGKQGYFLQLPRALQAAIQKRLQMFVLRSKVKLEDVSDQWIRIGVGYDHLDANSPKSPIHAVFGAVPDTLQSIHETRGRVIAVSPTRYECIIHPDHAVTVWNALAAHARKAGVSSWDLLAIRDGIIDVRTETQDQFVPQMANYELIGGVNFKKGCYPGQEIVARTQYRGILKRRMARVLIEDTTPPKLGESVFTAEFGDQAAGYVANVASAPHGGFEALVVAQIEGIKSDKMTLSDGRALRVTSLPYAVPLAVA
jgi:tRNA-modifying protein YgfZ